MQALAGHRDIGTTQRYLPRSPASVHGSIQLLQQPTSSTVVESVDTMETTVFANQIFTR
jgi:hypothetical protein